MGRPGRVRMSALARSVLGSFGQDMTSPDSQSDRQPISLDELRATLDLWGCMWQPEEQEAFETALVRSMTDEHPTPTRLHALAACHVIATPRLLAAAARIAEAAVFPPEIISFIERSTVAWHRLHAEAGRMRGNVLAVEILLARAEGGADASADALLDWVDVRDLVAVARTTTDRRLFAEVERRLRRRGKYQRGRAANVLGFALRDGGHGERGGRSPISGELSRPGS